MRVRPFDYNCAYDWRHVCLLLCVCVVGFLLILSGSTKAEAAMSHKMTYNSEGTEVLLAWKL